MGSLPPEPKPSEITPEGLYRRREFIKQGALFVGTSAVVGKSLVALSSMGGADSPAAPPPVPSGIAGGAWQIRERGRYVVNEEPTPYRDITTYNNYYELGVSKSEPAKLGFRIRPRPWALHVSGEIAEPKTLDIDTLIRWFGLEERVYRMRCVEAWSMVIPWVGIPLKDIIATYQPTSQAKYVELVTAFNPAQMPGQTTRMLPWPYVEGLRMDEAMNPLTILAVGLYEEALPNQDGAPIRLVVPWKYGFKGVKSITKIRFVDYQPKNTWQVMASNEYGFYANVNPNVDHPRWSQASERRIGEFFRRKTLPFNGYADQVASMYSGMDPKKLY
jgi:sulfoxide reductase catalytic subunit YedY